MGECPAARKEMKVIDFGLNHRRSPRGLLGEGFGDALYFFGIRWEFEEGLESAASEICVYE
jgi:hypothetical protein